MHLKWKWKNVDIICYKLMPLVICKEIQITDILELNP